MRQQRHMWSSLQAFWKCLALFRIHSFLFLQEGRSLCLFSSKLGFLLFENIVTAAPSGLERLHRFNALLCLKEWKGIPASPSSWERALSLTVIVGQNSETILNAETTFLPSHILVGCLTMLTQSSGIANMLQKKATIDTHFVPVCWDVKVCSENTCQIKLSEDHLWF